MKILVFAGLARSLIGFRGDLIKEMVARGHEVVAVAPESGYEDRLGELGARFIQVKFNRLSTNPLRDISLVMKLRKIMKMEKPDVYFGYTIKPVIYGSIAAKLAGIKSRYAMITGLGSVFIDGRRKKKYIRMLVELLYKAALSCAKRVFFQNPDDRDDFVRMKLLKYEKCELVNGSGVNMERFKKIPPPNEPVFLFVGSVMRDKGACEFFEAARILHTKHPEARCHVVGGNNNRLSCVTDEEIQPYVDDKSIELFGVQDDVRPFLAACRIFVLPSYREGTPRSVLEAMATGRAILTTDAPGCRETVISGVNGFLVPVKDAEALAEKMCYMIEHEKETAEMCEKSYEICSEKYEVGAVNSFMLRVMEL